MGAIAVSKKEEEQIEKLRKERLGHINELQLQAMIIRTWNAYRDEVRVLVDKVRWDSQTEFPTIA